jgi:hypothetical protein
MDNEKVYCVMQGLKTPDLCVATLNGSKLNFHVFRPSGAVMETTQFKGLEVLEGYEKTNRDQFLNLTAERVTNSSIDRFEDLVNFYLSWRAGE